MESVVEVQSAKRSYALKNEKGEGACSKVYDAQPTDAPEERVVIKIQKDISLKNEIAILQRLLHPTIGRVLDYGTTSGGKDFLVLEYCGTSLEDLFREKKAPFECNGKMILNDAVSITLEVVLALKYCHNVGVCHGDVHEGNILFHNGNVKLIDFNFGITCAELSPDGFTYYCKKDIGYVGQLFSVWLSQPTLPESEDAREQLISELLDNYKLSFKQKYSIDDIISILSNTLGRRV